MTTFAFTVLGPPRPWQRAQVGANGKHFKPRRTRAYQKLVATVAGLMRPRAWPLEARYRVEAKVFFPDARTRDIDNVAKSLLDGLNGVLWKDDRQVELLSMQRAVDRTSPRIEVVVDALEEAR